MPVDPQVAAVLAMLPSGGPPMSDALLDSTRSGFGLMNSLGVGEPPAIAGTLDRDADGVPVRIYTPLGSIPSSGWPVVVFFHGGGWTIGSVADYEPFTVMLAALTEAVVISVDYRLAPEHPFPAATDDCIAALRWVGAHAGELGLDPHRIAVAGDSAGGNLSAVIAQMIRDDGGPALCFQALIYPVVDCDFARGSYRDNATGYFLEADGMKYFFGSYCRSGTDPAIPAVSPLRANSLAGLPPALVITAEFDLLRDEGNAYAAALSAAGVAVEVKQYEGMIHGFVMMPAIVAGGREGFDHVVRALRAVFGTV